ncbi:MAG: FAD-dependent hydroxylase [Xenococcus sp. MO_188.B8]|nr:FAD-dependent hydroxylase [Xenococcus sp. MO_188.B8]
MISELQDNGVTTSCDIAIAGGGIVGVTLAAILKNSGLKVIIVEAKPLEVAAARTQAYAFSLLSSRIYEGIGIWKEIIPHIGKFKRIRLSDSDFPQIVKFETADLNTDYLGYVAQHNVVLTALQKYITDCDNIHWLCPGEVTDVVYQDDAAQVAVKVKGQKRYLKAKLVIGADGARSHIRSLAKITTRGWKYWQSCIAFTIKHTAAENDTAFERFWATGPMGVLPLPGNRCQIVWTNPHERAKKLQALEEKEFIKELEYYTQGSLGNLTLASDRVIFPVQLMQCDRYIKSRLALIGDAAHCCHPVGGQGLNLGIRDAATLAQILIKAHNQGQDIGSLPVLKEYETWRKQENLAILGFTDFLDRFFSNSWLPIVIIRRLGLWLMSNLQPLKIFALKLMTGLKGKTPKLAQNN